MKLQHFPLIVASAVAFFCSCDFEKPYTITGTLDMPEQLPYGDTLIDVPSFENTWVYLLDLDNHLLDSAQILDNSFSFIGKVKESESHFVQFSSQIGQTLMVIEPGDIEMVITPAILVSGTPSNDCMADLDAALENLNYSTYEYLAQVTDSLRQNDEEVSDEIQMAIATEYQSTMYALLDSVYEANKDNNGGAYAVVMRLMGVESSEQFEEEISYYPDYIQSNELIQFNLRLLREYEKNAEGMPMQELDPSMIVPMDDGMPQK